MEEESQDLQWENMFQDKKKPEEKPEEKNEHSVFLKNTETMIEYLEDRLKKTEERGAYHINICMRKNKNCDCDDKYPDLKFLFSNDPRFSI